MSKEIYITDPDGDPDYDGEEGTDEDEMAYEEMMDQRRFELSTYNY